MLHDPEDYPEPDRFNPERFLRDGEINPDVRDPTSLLFGFGRRYVGFLLELCVSHSAVGVQVMPRSPFRDGRRVPHHGIGIACVQRQPRRQRAREGRRPHLERSWPPHLVCPCPSLSMDDMLTRCVLAQLS